MLPYMAPLEPYGALEALWLLWSLLKPYEALYGAYEALHDALDVLGCLWSLLEPLKPFGAFLRLQRSLRRSLLEFFAFGFRRHFGAF